MQCSKFKVVFSLVSAKLWDAGLGFKVEKCISYILEIIIGDLKYIPITRLAESALWYLCGLGLRKYCNRVVTFLNIQNRPNFVLFQNFRTLGQPLLGENYVTDLERRKKENKEKQAGAELCQAQD